jgi:hypothetical protein
MTLFAMLLGFCVGAVVSKRRRCRSDRRLGLLPAAPTPEALRAVRLCQLGDAGTLRVYNVGEILHVVHVDYERGELVVAKVTRSGW